jgi:RHH-type transcriptional regulator, rel operon repressor / antitoxin RelB
MYFIMASQGISLRIASEKLEQLDQLAETQKRDRTFVINEAIDAYLELQRWQLDHIKASVAEADAGEFVSAQKVARALKKWRSS